MRLTTMPRFQNFSLSLLIALVLFPAHLLASRSLRLDSGATHQFNIPSQTPFVTLGNTRIEMRIHNFVPPSGTTGVRRYLLRTPGITVFLRSSFPVNANPEPEICATDEFDLLPRIGKTICVAAATGPDLILRIRRDTVARVFTLEAWRTETGERTAGYCANPGGRIFGCPIDVVETRSWAGTAIVGDEAGTQASIAWLKWHGDLEADTALPHGYDPADLASWNLENSLTNSSANRLHMSASGAAFVNTPIFPPVVVLRTANAPSWSNWISQRAGHPAQLDASGSYSSSDSPALEFRWAQVEGPSQLLWDDRTVEKPVVEGLIFGTYTIKAEVSDINGQAGQGTLTFGAVATGNNGVVIQKDAWVDRILGPQLSFGQSPWPWFDERHKKISDFYGQLLDTDPAFAAYWDAPGLEGTVALSPGSATVTGSGTRFRSAFACNGTDEMVVQWGQGAQRAHLPIAACPSDTQLTLQFPWNRGPAETGLTYSKAPASAFAWYAQSTNNNYYDNVMAHYAMYYRSGNKRYLEAARLLADRWWRMPMIDEGKNYQNGLDLAIRSRSLTGLFLRGLDGRPEILDGLRPLWNHERQTVSGATWPAEDIREHGYLQFFFALAAQYDRSPANRALYRDYITQGLTNKWVPALRTKSMGTGELTYWIPPIVYRPGTVSVTNGSNLVIGSATQWDASTCQRDYNWFYIEGDVRAYRCEYVSPTLLRITPAFLGSTVSGRRHQAGNLVGGGVQPFMMGIAGQAMLATAEATSHPQAQRFYQGAVQWLRHFGFRPATNGIYYGRLYPYCEPYPDQVEECTIDSNGDDGSRYLSGEVLGFLGKAYLATKDESLREMGDSLMKANFSHPRFPGPLTGGGTHNSVFEDSALIFTNKKAKDFGFWFGFGAAPGWLAARLGGVSPREATQALVSFDQSDPEVALVRAVVTAPDSTTAEYTCPSSPCSVEVDRRQGAHWVTLQFVSGEGTPLPSPDPFLLYPR